MHTEQSYRTKTHICLCSFKHMVIESMNAVRKANIKYSTIK
jgi:hypothetical protein